MTTVPPNGILGISKAPDETEDIPSKLRIWSNIDRSVDITMADFVRET